MSASALAETSPAADAEEDSSPSTAPVDRSPGSEHFINRELSLLEFQRRVLEEARDFANPLLERVKFLSILGSNLDEFFSIRVAGLLNQLGAGVVDPPPDGMSPAEQLAAIRRVAQKLYDEAHECLADELVPELAQGGIHLLDYSELSSKQTRSVERYFEERVAPVLTPLAVDPGRPFPHISTQSLNLAVVIRDRSGEERFARVKVPTGRLPMLVPLKRSSGGVKRDGTLPRNHYFVALEQVIAQHLGQLFPGLDVVEAHPFRIVRDADPAFQELEASDLLRATEQAIWRRQFGSVVMLAVNRAMPAAIRDLLVRHLEMDARDVYTIDGPLQLGGIASLSAIDRPDLKERPFRPAIQSVTEDEDEDVFAAIRRRDVLLHHPYDSFRPVVEFLEASARDPRVLAIKQTLYRVGSNSPIVHALLEARQNHKEVAVLVELKARFDEESNIEWAKALEREGVHVIYGLLGLKTHSKITLVVREEADGIRRYVHLSTGNYNVATAPVYTDLGLFTADPDVGADATDLFNYLTGYSQKTDYKRLIVAPIRLRSKLEELIRREVQHCRAGRGGRLIFKANSIADRGLIETLYEASSAGVEIDLVVRGICCLRPGVANLSERIRVRSIVGRFLEHSRVLYFANGGDEEVYLGSPDLMARNLDHRVELLFPVSDPKMVRYIRDEVLALALADDVKARILQPNGRYERALRGDDPPLCAQEQLLSRHLATSRDRIG